MLEMAIVKIGLNPVLLADALTENGIHVTPEQVRNKLRQKNFLESVSRNGGLKGQVQADILAHLAKMDSGKDEFERDEQQEDESEYQEAKSADEEPDSGDLVFVASDDAAGAPDGDQSEEDDEDGERAAMLALRQAAIKRSLISVQEPPESKERRVDLTTYVGFGTLQPPLVVQTQESVVVGLQYTTRNSVDIEQAYCVDPTGRRTNLLAVTTTQYKPPLAEWHEAVPFDSGIDYITPGDQPTATSYIPLPDSLTVPCAFRLVYGKTMFFVVFPKPRMGKTHCFAAAEIFKNVRFISFEQVGGQVHQPPPAPVAVRGVTPPQQEAQPLPALQPIQFNPPAGDHAQPAAGDRQDDVVDTQATMRLSSSPSTS